jgi:hydroxyacylglutathione hydrolase
MRLESIKDHGISHMSYYLSDGGEAVVIDPRRDVEVYIDLAKEDCAKIEYILETHRNEDYVIGSLELKEITEAKICHSMDLKFGYGDQSLKGNELINIGRLRIMTIATPGHTFESYCYAVEDTRLNQEPIMVFTGDTLFSGDVGRTDLMGPENWSKLSGLLFDSIHEKLLPLGDQVMVYPAHTAGSICGNRISDRDVTSIGIERLTNPLVGLSREVFIKTMLENQMLRPPYFSRMEEWNLNGPPLLRNATKPKQIQVQDFDAIWKQPDVIIIDTRNPDAFAASHIPGSLNIWLEGSSYYPGWVVGYDKRIILVLERKEDAEKAITYLNRIGFVDIIGYLCPGIDAWRNKGNLTESSGVLTAPELKNLLSRNAVTIIDVRDAEEYGFGHIPGAINFYVGQISENVGKISSEKPVVLTCSWGGRGSLAASILKHRGFKDVFNLLGGMNSWKSLSYTLESSKPRMLNPSV